MLREGEDTADLDNAVAATVGSIEYQGARVLLALESPETEDLNVVLQERDHFDSPVAVGEKVILTWDVDDAHLLH